MTVFEHSMNDQQFEEFMALLVAACVRQGLAFNDLQIAFVKVCFEARPCREALKEEVSLCGTMPLVSEFISLKQTAWERRNSNAPWYRQFTAKRRRQS